MMENGGWMTNGYGGRQERPWAEGGTVLASKDTEFGGTLKCEVYKNNKITTGGTVC